MSDASTLAPVFSGKIALFYMSRGESSVSLEYIEISTIGGRVILSGRVPQLSGEEWIAKLQAGVAWDHVSHYLLFDTLDEFAQRMRAVQNRGGLLRRLLGRLW